MDPVYATKAFFGGPDPPGTRGLLDIKGWEKMGLTEAAQAVQHSAFPDAYAKWETLANAIVGRASGVDCGATNASGQAKVVVDAAMKWLGTPYCWAGGDEKGPTTAAACPNGPPGFDCSGLTLYAYAQVGIHLDHWTGSQLRAGVLITDPNQLAPGDLLFFSTNRTEQQVHHVGIYLGNGSLVHAPQTGDVVKVANNIWAPGSYWTSQFYGGVRLLTGKA
jgi:cell wall-associated NlpC family hydrolase